MKRSLKSLAVIAATAMSFVAVQNVAAETVSGSIEEITTRPNVVTVYDELTGEFTDVYGVRINYLANQYNIELEEGDLVSIEASEFLCSDGTTKLKASSVTIDDVTVSW